MTTERKQEEEVSDNLVGNDAVVTSRSSAGKHSEDEDESATESEDEIVDASIEKMWQEERREYLENELAEITKRYSKLVSMLLAKYKFNAEQMLEQEGFPKWVPPTLATERKKVYLHEQARMLERYLEAKKRKFRDPVALVYGGSRGARGGRRGRGRGRRPGRPRGRGFPPVNVRVASMDQRSDPPPPVVLSLFDEGSRSNVEYGEKDNASVWGFGPNGRRISSFNVNVTVKACLRRLVRDVEKKVKREEKDKMRAAKRSLELKEKEQRRLAKELMKSLKLNAKRKEAERRSREREERIRLKKEELRKAAERRTREREERSRLKKERRLKESKERAAAKEARRRERRAAKLKEEKERSQTNRVKRLLTKITSYVAKADDNAHKLSIQTGIERGVFVPGSIMSIRYKSFEAKGKLQANGTIRMSLSKESSSDGDMVFHAPANWLAYAKLQAGEKNVELPLLTKENLPEGWTILTFDRSGPTTFYHLFESPAGMRYRSMAEVNRLLKRGENADDGWNHVQYEGLPLFVYRAEIMRLVEETDSVITIASSKLEDADDHISSVMSVSSSVADSLEDSKHREGENFDDHNEATDGEEEEEIVIVESSSPPRKRKIAKVESISKKRKAKKKKKNDDDAVEEAENPKVRALREAQKEAEELARNVKFMKERLGVSIGDEVCVHATYSFKAFANPHTAWYPAKVLSMQDTESGFVVSVQHFRGGIVEPILFDARNVDAAAVSIVRAADVKLVFARSDNKKTKRGAWWPAQILPSYVGKYYPAVEASRKKLSKVENDDGSLVLVYYLGYKTPRWGWLPADSTSCWKMYRPGRDPNSAFKKNPLKSSQKKRFGPALEMCDMVHHLLWKRHVSLAGYGQNPRTLRVREIYERRDYPITSTAISDEEMYECEYNCGFENTSMEKVEAHESTCPKRPRSTAISLPADDKTRCENKENNTTAEGIAVVGSKGNGGGDDEGARPFVPAGDAWHTPAASGQF